MPFCGPYNVLSSIKHVGPTPSSWQKEGHEGGHAPGFGCHIVHVVLPTVSYTVSASFVLRYPCVRLLTRFPPLDGSLRFNCGYVFGQLSHWRLTRHA